MIKLVDVLQFIRPGAEFYLSGDELTWVDKVQSQPTQSEIETGFADYASWQSEQDAAKAQAKAVLLERLGLTQEEFNILTAQS